MSTTSTPRISLTRYLMEQQRQNQRIPAQLRLLLEVVARACKQISHAVNKGALGDVLGSANSENVQGNKVFFFCWIFGCRVCRWICGLHFCSQLVLPCDLQLARSFLLFAFGCDFFVSAMALRGFAGF